MGCCCWVEAAIGVDNARKESSNEAVTLPAELHLELECLLVGILKVIVD